MEKIIIEREKLFSILKKKCHNNYSFGIHGIDEYKMYGDPISVKKQLDYLKKNILEKGLYIENSRRLLGTVAFFNDKYETEAQFVKYHRYGSVKEHILLALPKYLKNSNGESFYIGRPTYDNMYPEEIATQGYQLTSLSDALIPDYGETRGIVDSMFILGTFTYLDDDKIEFSFNPKHIVFNDGKVPDDYFYDRKTKFLNSLKEYGINEVGNSSFKNLKEMFRHLHDIINFNRQLFYDSRLLANLLKQYENKEIKLVPAQVELIKRTMGYNVENQSKNTVPGYFPILFNETIRQHFKEHYYYNVYNKKLKEQENYKTR